MNPRILYNSIRIAPKFKQSPMHEVLFDYFLRKASSANSGKSNYRGVGEPDGPYATVIFQMQREISYYSGFDNPEYSDRIAIFRNVLEFAEWLADSSKYCGSFATSTEQKATHESGNKKFRNWDEHVTHTVKDEVMGREIPKETPYKVPVGEVLPKNRIAFVLKTIAKYEYKKTDRWYLDRKCLSCNQIKRYSQRLVAKHRPINIHICNDCSGKKGYKPSKTYSDKVVRHPHLEMPKEFKPRFTVFPVDDGKIIVSPAPPSDEAYQKRSANLSIQRNA